MSGQRSKVERTKWGQEEKGVTENKMFGWYHWLNGHEFEQTRGDSVGQRSLVCCSPWGCEELAMTERLRNNTICKVEGKARKTSQRKKKPGWVLKDGEESAKGREAVGVPEATGSRDFFFPLREDVQKPLYSYWNRAAAQYKSQMYNKASHNF